MSPITILIIGGGGQVGIELMRAAWPAHVRLVAPERSGLDLTDAASVSRMFARERIDAVINSAAFTAVDRAEQEAGQAFAVNALGPALLADATRDASAPLIQISSDYVFNGEAGHPYDESAAADPLGVYGASKRAGELAALRGNARSLVLRTGWIVSAHRTNFLKTMLSRAAEGSILRVVDDQRGRPTGAADLAAAVVTLALRQLEDPSAPAGVYHFGNGGDATWCDLARHIVHGSRARGGPQATVEGIPTTDYPTAARRPADSRLACGKIERDYGIVARPWTEAVDDILNALFQGDEGR